MGVDLKKEVIAAPDNNNNSLPRVEGWWSRQWRSRLEIPVPAKVFLFIAGVLFEVSSDASTLQLVYVIADKTDPWITISTVVVNGSTVGWIARGLGFDIAKSILLPIALQAFSKDMMIRSMPSIIGGLMGLTVSMFATMGIMQSHADWEKKKLDNDSNYIEQHNKTMSEIDSQVNEARNNAKALRNTSYALLNVDRPRGAANVSSNIVKSQSDTTALLMKKLDNEKPIEPEKNGQLTGVYDSLKSLTGFNSEKSTSAFNIILSFSEEFLGVLCLTLGANWVRKGFAGRGSDAARDVAKNVNEPSEQEPLQATVAAVRDVPRDVGVSLEKTEPSPQQDSNILKNALDKLTEKEETLLRSAIEMIKAGKLQNLSHGNLQKQLSCGSEASALIRGELIKKKYALERGRRLMVNPRKIDKNK